MKKNTKDARTMAVKVCEAELAKTFGGQLVADQVRPIIVAPEVGLVGIGGRLVVL